ncbi:MAG: hypothetical protein Q9201_001310 [Fulgogasparrea decipioides]
MNFILAIAARTAFVVAAFYVVKRLASLCKYEKAIQDNHCAKPCKYPHKDPFLGLDLFLEIAKAFRNGSFLETNRHHFDLYGTTFEANLWGVRVIKTIQPEIMEAVYATFFKNFGLQPLRLDVGGPFFGKGILTTDGAFWEHSRALIRPTFARTRFANFHSLEMHVDRLIDLIPGDGSTFDLQPLFRRLILDTSTEFIFGESTNSLLRSSSLDAQGFLQAFDDAVAGVGKRVMMGKMRHLVRDKKWEVACKTVHNYCDRYVAAALRGQNESAPKQSTTEVERWVLLREMAKETQDPLDLRYQILNVFSPGRDSTGILLSNVFFFVARQPSSWKRLRNEVLSLEGKPLDYDNLNSLTYVNHCLKESLRLAPFATFNQRICLQDTVLPMGGGKDGTEPLFVKQGDLVETNFYAMHRDRDIWGDDADEFRPERWEKSHPTWAFMGFNGGPRTCPAKQMVYTEAAYVITRLARQYARLENRDPCEAWQEEMRLNFQSKNGVQVGMCVTA